MSSLYNLEPQPTAKVLLQTTSGDILLELFAKQTPLSSRNFLQLCLDGYYDGTIFHRLVPGFVIQGGDPTGTGEGGEAIYDGGIFDDEFHSRLKFNRRGLLGMANSGRKNDNGSQFFLTLGDTKELNGTNTMFGRVVGDTIYNLVKMGEAETTSGEGSERPLYPTKITGTEILVNPFDGMVKREAKAKPALPEAQGKKKGKKKAGKALLSFAGDEDDSMDVPMAKKAKFNPKLVEADHQAQVRESSPVKQARNSKPKPEPKARAGSPPKILVERQKQLPLPNEEEASRSPSTSPEPEEVGKVSSLLDRTNAQIAELKASMKRNIPSSAAETSRKKSALEQMIPASSTRGRKRKHGNQDSSKTDAQALKMLDAFRAKLDQAPPERASESEPTPTGKETQEEANGANVGDGDEEAQLCDLHFIADCQSCQSWDKGDQENAEDAEDDDKAWMSHALSFEKDRLGKDLTWKRKNEEELVVIDPLQKAKDIKEERMSKRKTKGTSNRVWDRDRDRGRLPERTAGERVK
ncbi:MAG: Peptidyl-prolyl isomerase cwc27 [Stictis urceolatum]|nr:Peptidyl-prolyl isomerase cwc27 [Stictis urceolata]